MANDTVNQPDKITHALTLTWRLYIGVYIHWYGKYLYNNLGKDLVQTYIRKDFRESVRAVISNALKGQGRANYKFPLFSKAGERVEILLNATTRRDADGNVIGVVGVGQGITCFGIFCSSFTLKKVIN